MFMSEFRRRMRSKERTRNDGMITDYAIAQSSFLPPSPNGYIVWANEGEQEDQNRCLASS